MPYYNTFNLQIVPGGSALMGQATVQCSVITLDTNETNIRPIYWSEQSACDVMGCFSPRRGKQMWAVNIWESNFLANWLLGENIGLRKVLALPEWNKEEWPGKHSGQYNIIFAKLIISLIINMDKSFLS
jgi:hypothetical protein